MKRNDFYCVALHRGRSLTQELRENLLVEAWHLAKSHRKSKRIKGKEFEGSIRIKQESLYHAGMTGWLFEARFETEQDNITVDFLVSHNAFKELEEAEDDQEFSWHEDTFRVDGEGIEFEGRNSEPAANPILKAKRACAAN